MPDQRSVMKEYRLLEEKRQSSRLTPAEETRHAELRDLIGPEMGAGGLKPGFDVGAAAARLRESLRPAGLRTQPPPVPEPSPEPEPDLDPSGEQGPDLGRDLEAAWSDQPFAPIGGSDAGAEGFPDGFDPASLGLEQEGGGPAAEQGWDPGAVEGWDPGGAWDAGADGQQAGGPPEIDPSADQGWDPNAAQGWDPNAAWDPGTDGRQAGPPGEIDPAAGEGGWDPDAAQGWDPNAAWDAGADGQGTGAPPEIDPSADQGWDPGAAQGWDPNAAWDPASEGPQAGAPLDLDPSGEQSAEPGAAPGWDPNGGLLESGALDPGAAGEPSGFDLPEPEYAGGPFEPMEPLDPSLEPEGPAGVGSGEPDLAPEGWGPAPPQAEAEPGLDLGEYDEMAAPAAPPAGGDPADLEAMLPFDAAAESAAVPEGLGAELDLAGEGGLPAAGGPGEYDDTAGFFGSGSPGAPEPGDLEAGPGIPGLVPGDLLPESAVDHGFGQESSGSFEGAGPPAYQPPEPPAEEELMEADVLEEVPTLDGAEILEEIAPEEPAPAEPPPAPAITLEPPPAEPPAPAIAVEPPPPQPPASAPEPVPQPPAPQPAAAQPAPPAPSPTKIPGRSRVVVHTVEGQVKRGVLEDAELDAVVLGLAPQPGADPEVIQADRVKAIFFMLEPGKPPPAAEGKRVRVTFRDGRQIAGFSPAYTEGGAGFFMVPADTKTNTARIWVYRSSVKSVAVS